MITVLIADDHQMFREYLHKTLKAFDIEVIGDAPNGKVLLELLENDFRKPDVVLLDLDMPVMNGKAALLEIKRKYPQIKVIILSGFSEGGLVNDIMANGANSFVSKHAGTKTLVEAILNTKVLYNYSNIARKQNSIFTDTELKIIPHILEGCTNRQIAIKEAKAERTIEGHRARLYEKTNCSNAAEFSKYCTRIGLNFLSEAG